MKYISQFYDINKKTQTEQVLQNMSDIADLKDADDTLQENIDKEVQDRTDADSALAYDIGELQSQIDGLGNVFTLKGSVATYTDLPASDNTIGDVWYVEDEAVGYVWIDDNGTERWEQLGLPIDLSDYVTTSDLALALEDYQEKLTAGAGISIIDNVISATGGTQHLYRHDVKITSTTFGTMCCSIINDNPNAYTLTSEIGQWLYDNNYRTGDNCLPVSSCITLSGTQLQMIQGIASSDGTLNICTRVRNSITLSVDFANETASLTIGAPSRDSALLYSLNNSVDDKVSQIL